MTTRLESLLFARADDDSLALHADGVDHSWRELAGRAARIAEALESAGIEPGAPVGVMLPDGVDLVATMFAVWRVRSLYAPLNPRLGREDLDHILETVDPQLVVTTVDRADRFDGRALVVVGGDEPARRDGRQGTARHDEGVALVQFTSGTTGRPKAVLIEHTGQLELIDGVLDKLRGGKAPDPDRTPMPNLIPVSMSVSAGIYNLLFAYRSGAGALVMNGFDTKRFADLVARFGIRSTVLPPAAMTMLADDTDVTDLSPLRYVRSISAPLSPLQARRFRDRFDVAVLNCWGQTEIGGEVVGWTAADFREYGDDKLGAVGRPHEGVHIRIVGPDGAPVASPDDEGEIWIKTPAMSAGYADGTDLSDRLSADGWFRTGDIGRFDAEGFLWIDGRISDMINRGGLKVFPAEVEEVLRLHDDVDDAAVVPRPDDRLGEVPVAFVAGTAEADALEWLCRDHLAPYKVPVAFHRLDELPRNEAGKVRKAGLIASLTPTSGGTP